MRRWILLSFAVAGILVVADQAAASYTERRVRDEVEARLFVDTDADIQSFPFTARLLAAGQVSHLNLTFSPVLGHGLDLERIRFDVRDVRLERGRLLNSAVRVTDVADVGVTASVERSAIPPWAQTRLDEVDVAVTADGIRLAVADRSVLLPMVSPMLVPCRPLARVVGSTLQLSCTVTDLPPFLARAVVDL